MYLTILRTGHQDKASVGFNPSSIVVSLNEEFNISFHVYKTKIIALKFKKIAWNHMCECPLYKIIHKAFIEILLKIVWIQIIINFFEDLRFKSQRP